MALKNSAELAREVLLKTVYQNRKDRANKRDKRRVRPQAKKPEVILKRPMLKRERYYD